MLALQPEFILDDHGERIAVRLDMHQWKCVLQELEELEDIRDADRRLCGLDEMRMRHERVECPHRKR